MQNGAYVTLGGRMGGAGVDREETCLVLGGGGLAGIAWMTGLLAGLADAGGDITHASLLIGTSAGATVAAQLGSGLTLDALFLRQTDPELQSQEIASNVDMATFGASLSAATKDATSVGDAWRRIGVFALAAKTVSEIMRRDVIAKRLPSPAWPERRMQIVAVDAKRERTACSIAPRGFRSRMP